MTSVNDHVLSVRSASRWFETPSGRVIAVDDVSLEIGPGEIVGLAGPSGSGKTTLLNLVAGWEEPDSGRVDRNVGSIGGWGGLAVVPQELGLIPELTAEQNVWLAGRLSLGASPSSRRRAGSTRPVLGESADVLTVAALFDHLDLLGLADRMPDELSIGEQQRVAVARAARCGPRLLIADEPTAHQDERHADQIMEVLANAAASGGAVIVATHDSRLLAGVDRVLHLLDGRLVSPESAG